MNNKDKFEIFVQWTHNMYREGSEEEAVVLAKLLSDFTAYATSIELCTGALDTKYLNVKYIDTIDNSVKEIKIFIIPEDCESFEGTYDEFCGIIYSCMCISYGIINVFNISKGAVEVSIGY